MSQGLASRLVMLGVAATVGLVGWYLWTGVRTPENPPATPHFEATQQPPTRPQSPAPSAVPPRTGSPENASVCRTDADCLGPRHADCTKATCRDGQCLYDRSQCDCESASDCDDGDPCTKNHCFARTKKCIFIPGECR